jgi:uncharacterized delta-60 repeat protein
MRWKITALAVLALALCEGSAFGAAGDLDPTFGTAGIAVYGRLPDATVETLVQPDGKIVRVDVETTADGEQSDFRIRRFNADGSPDRTFGDAGLAVADFGGKDVAAGAALQPDGKLVVAGRTDQHPVVNSQTIVARFDKSGRLDPTFAPGGDDGDGKLIVSESRFDTVEAVVIRPDGDIALVGARQVRIAPDTSSNDQLWARLLKPDGAPGDITYDYAPLDEFDTATLGTVTADGNLLAAGTTSIGTETNSKLALARWTPAGKLDPTLGGTGKLSVPVMSVPVALMALPDGRFLVAGTTGGPDTECVLVRFSRDGSLDPTFGDGGVARLELQGAEYAISAAPQSDGKALLVGASDGGPQPAVARFTTGGMLDATYGKDGIARPFAGQFAGVYSAALAPGGKLVLAGAGLIGGSLGALVARLLPDPPPVPSDGGPPGGAGAGDGDPATDTQAPVIGALNVTRKAAGKRARIRFSLSEPARVDLALKRRGRRAQRFALDAVGGANRARTPRRLKRGRYRLTAVATDAAGNTTQPRRVRFTVAAPRHAAS